MGQVERTQLSKEVRLELTSSAGRLEVSEQDDDQDELCSEKGGKEGPEG